jgi:hypothetical protein
MSEKLAVSKFRAENAQVFRTSWTLKTEAEISFRTSVTIYESTKRVTPDDLNSP